MPGADAEMDMDSNTLRILLMLGVMVGFLGICVWAWSKKRKSTFRDASQLPLEDDTEVPTENGVKE